MMCQNKSSCQRMTELTNTPTMIPMVEINGTPSRDRRSIGKPDDDATLTLNTGTIERRSTSSLGEDENLPRRPRKPFDFNQYATRKTIATGLLDLALLSANACQMKICLQLGPRQTFFHLLMVLISTSVVLQIAAAILFMLVARGNVRDSETEDERNNQKRTALLNDIATGLVFLITVVNVFITSFGMTDKVEEENSPASNSNKVTPINPPTVAS
ncbi:ninjurin-1-like isoform X2 [Lineus longissimus]|uniref:ninjurin-1-like isoform X2 n=1 Tax=Lineus longissimus TaxID=88925 RepID=UPI002B4ED7A0